MNERKMKKCGWCGKVYGKRGQTRDSKMGKLSDKDKKKLRCQLYERDGKKCHYCGIEEEDFPKIWGDKFYGGIKRGRILEIDRKDNNQDYSLENSVLACALCNMAKSDKFTYDEFKKVGDVIRKIWQQRKSSVLSVTA